MTSSSPAIAQRDLLRLAGQRRAPGPGAGATTSWQMPSRWVDSTTGYAAAWPLGRAGHQRRQLAAEVDELLGEDPHAGRRGRRERRRALVGRARRTRRPCRRTRRGVVLRTHGKPNASTSASVGDDARCAGTGTPSSASRAAHHALVLGVHERLRARAGRRCPASSSACRCSVGTCSWSKVTTRAAVGDRAQRVEVAVVADDVVGDHLGGGDALAPRRAAAAGCPRAIGGLGHHPGQLAAADDGERWGAAARARGHGLVTRSSRGRSVDGAGGSAPRSRSAGRGRGSW